MTSTLVTGGYGFIGRYVTEALLDLGREVLVLDHIQDRMERPAGVTAFLGDIRDATAVTEAMAHVDSWIHLAGVLGTQETIANPLPATETNILGGLNVLNAAAHYDLPGVNIAVGNWWETNTYSITKSCVERFCEMFRRYHRLPVTTVRALNAYGPRQSVAAPYGPSKVRKITPSFVMRALAGDPIEVYGSGDQIMDMIFVTDVASILVRALLATEAAGAGLGGVIEAGTGRHLTVNDIAKMVVDACGQGRVEYLPMRPGETPDVVVCADTSTLGLIDLDPETLIPFEQGIEVTVDYYRSLMRRTG